MSKLIMIILLLLGRIGFLDETEVASSALFHGFDFDVAVLLLAVGPKLLHDEEILIEINLLGPEEIAC